MSGSSGTTVTVTPAGASTTYTVNGSSGSCTASPYTLTILVNALPVVTATVSPNDTVCSGSSVTLNGSGASTYAWTSGVTNGTSYTPTGTATYTVTGTDANGCSATATQKVTINALPVITVSASPGGPGICPGATATLTATSATAISYTWTNTAATGTVITVNPTTTTVYTVEGTDAFGCVNVKTRTVTVKPAPTVTVALTAICIGQTATLTATSTGSVTVGSYAWNTGAATTSITATPSVTTDYTVIATGTGGGACSDTVRTTLTVNALPVVTASATKTSVCAGGSTVLTGGGASSYAWTGGAINGSAIVPAATQTYTVTGTDVNGCSDTASIIITVKPRPTVTATTTTTTVCLGSSVTLSGSGASTYTWSSGVTNGVAFNPTTTQTYTLAGTGSNGCKNFDTISVAVINCTSSGINQVTHVNVVTVYPNPSNGIVYIKTNALENASIEMYNTLGELVFVKSVSSSIESIDVENLHTGVYLLRVKQNNIYIHQSNLIITK
jgi:hypothetical protein